MATFTPLSDQYYAGVLDFGGVRILLDCGTDVDFEGLGDKITAVAPTVDLVLLSHAELRHVGGLPAAKARYGLAAPVFATTPTIKNGALTLYEAWAGYRATRGRVAAKEKFDLDDVDAAFDKIRALKFDQPLSLRGRGAGVVVTAHRAGHSVGGAYWRISRGADEVVYAVDVHHARERHVDGTALAARGPDRRPAVLICDAGPLRGPAAPAPPRRAAEDAAVDAALSALRHGGHALFPAEGASRALELLLVLDEAWRRRNLGGAYDLVFVHATARSVLDFARSQLEWMAPEAQDSFDGTTGTRRGGGHPLALREVAEVLSKRSDAPKCVIAARSELETGAAARLLREWAGDARNVVVLTARPGAPLGAARRASVAARLEAGADALTVTRCLRAPLAGAALAAHLAARDEARRAAAETADRRAKADEMARKVLLIDDAADAAAAAGDDADDDAANGVAGVASAATDDGGRRARLEASRARLATLRENALFARFAEPAHATFAPLPKRPAADDYGAPLPAEVERAFLVARRSLLGLETRDGYGHLRDDAAPTASAAEALAAVEATPAAPAAPADVAYDEAPSDDDAAVSLEAHDEALAIRCRVVRAPGLEGLCDGRSLRALLATVKPRALVALPGPDGGAAAAALAAFARERLAPRGGAAHVATPAPGAAADLGAWLGRAPLVDARLSWRVLQAQAAGAVALGDGYDVCRVRDAVLVDADGDAPPALVLAPELPDAALAAGSRPPRLWLSAKDVVLPALKARLATEGVAAAFRAGALVCAGTVVVRKTVDDRGAGRIVVDGPLCDEYYTVSRIVREAFALV